MRDAAGNKHKRHGGSWQGVGKRGRAWRGTVGGTCAWQCLQRVCKEPMSQRLSALCMHAGTCTSLDAAPHLLHSQHHSAQQVHSLVHVE